MQKDSECPGEPAVRRHRYRDPEAILAAVETIDKAIQPTSDLDAVLDNVITAVFTVFRSDRAWLFFPCNPEIDHFEVTCESAVPAYPGAKALGMAVPMTADMAEYCRPALAAPGQPVVDPPGDAPMANDIALQFEVQSLMFMALTPSIGDPWMFGLHQCDRRRVWSDDERHLFRIIGSRITDALSSMLYLRRLKASERKWRNILIRTPQIGIGLDPQARLVFANAHFLELTGWREEEVIGQDWFDRFIPEAVRDEVRRVFATVVSRRDTQEYSTYENEIVLKNGELRTVAWSNVITRDARGDLEEITCLGIDLTERLKWEERVRQAQKMESIGNLAGGIAHDFNNILFPIVGMAELLLDDLPAGSLEAENAREILKAGQRGSDLVKQILAFSRQSEQKKMPVRLQQVLKEVLRLSRSTIPTDIEIERDIQADCGLVLADPTQLHQVAMNLITNAYHAMEDTGGTLTVGLRQTDVTPADVTDTPLEPGSYACLTVSDTGHGIPAGIMGNVFEPYFTTKKQGKGTGLGLAVAYGIVREHGGDITVTSEAATGTTFRVHLPLLDRPGDSLPAKEVAPLPCGTERILLVDDEEPIVRLEQQMLERLGYTVTTCTDSEEALASFRQDPASFDLLVTDMAMPHMTGERLAERVRALKPDLPVIICTGFSERLTPETTAAMGIDGLLMKPVIKARMAELVRRVLDRRTPPGDA